MASLVKPWIVRYVDAAGQRVPKGTPGARRERERAATWYGQGIPGQPPKKRIPLSRDKTAARRMLDDMVRDAERGRAGIPDAGAARRSLADHLADFERDAKLGLASRSRKTRRKPSPAHVALTVQRVRDVLGGCGFDYPSALNNDAPVKLAQYFDRRVGQPRKAGGLSQQSASFYLAAVRRFVWWLSAKARVAVRADLFDDVPGFDPKSDRKHARRDITPEELARLLAAARSSETAIRGLTGEDRYFLYLTAFSTGYRAGELAELHPENFDLDAAQPVVSLPPKFTKNKKRARQPLPPGVANQLRGYLAAKPRAKPVWSGTWGEKPAAVLKRDLAAAGVPYAVETSEGPKYADFHALRHSFLSALAAAGVGVKELQELARHSDPRLTLGVYTHARPEALGAAVARLQLPGVEDANPFAAWSRAELEAAVAGLTALVVAVATPLQPFGCTSGCTQSGGGVVRTGADGCDESGAKSERTKKKTPDKSGV